MIYPYLSLIPVYSIITERPLYDRNWNNNINQMSYVLINIVNIFVTIFIELILNTYVTII